MKRIIILVLIFGTVFNSKAQWVPTNGPNTEGFIQCFATDGNNIVAGTKNEGVFLSTNGGINWSQICNGLPRNSNDTTTFFKITSIAIDGTNIFAGTTGPYSWQCVIYFSTNNGQSWDSTNVNNPFASQIISAIFINGNTLLSGNDDELYISTDNGNNWIFGPNVNAVCFAKYGNNIFAGTYFS